MSGSSVRVVTLIDMDCFYCQVEARLNPIHKGKPLAVVQYNQWKGGGIIAVNYEARDKGVKRGMRGDEAKQKCPEIVLVSVASVRGKADLSKYRDAGKEVVDVFKEFCDCVERASIDEAYLDLTQVVEVRTQKLLDGGMLITADQLLSTFVVGFCPDESNDENTQLSGLREFLEDQKFNPETLRLAVAAALVEELRTEVLRRTGFHCSAGIAHNKILAKLVCGIHKPRRQTVLPASCVEQLFSALPVCKVRNLGGKFGSRVVEELGCETMGDLARFSKEDLQNQFDEKTGCWLYDIARGIDNDLVTPRLIPKSIGCSKNFPGRNSLRTKEDVEHWMKELCDEVAERLSQDLQENKRRAQLLTVSVSVDGQTTSRSNALSSYDGAKIATEALSLISRCNTAPVNSSAWQPSIKMIAISASKFVSDEGFRSSGIQSFFKQTPKNVKDDIENESINNKRSNNTLSKLNMKPTGRLSSNSALSINSYFKSQTPKPQTEDIKSTEEPESSRKPVDETSNVNVDAKGSAENSFFLSYLQKLKSTSVATSGSADEQKLSKSRPSDKIGSNRNSLNSSRESNLNVSERSDTSSKLEKTDEVLTLIMEMFPNPLDVEDSVISFLSTSMQETFYTWRSLFRRESGLLSPKKVELNPRRNGLPKFSAELSSPKKQMETQNVAQPKPKGGIESFFQGKWKESVDSEPNSSSSKSAEQRPGSSKSAEQQSGSSKSAEQQSGSSKSAEQQSGSSKSAEQQLCSSKSAEQQLCSSKSAEQQLCSSKSAEQQSCSSKSAEQQSCSSKSAEQQSGSLKSTEQPSTSKSSEQPGCSFQYPICEDSNSCDALGMDESSWDEMERCSICHRMILLREFPEHVDYHAAVSLDERLNKSDQEGAVVEASAVKTVVKPPAPAGKTVVKSSSGNSSVLPVRKRGRPPKNELLRPQSGKKLKSISSFFSVKGATL